MSETHFDFYGVQIPNGVYRYEFSPEEYCKLIERIEGDRSLYPLPRKPKAPIKARSEVTTSGFFFSRSETKVEYDHHAPEYLDQLRQHKDSVSQWEANQRALSSGKFNIYAPWGEVEIEVKKA